MVEFSWDDVTDAQNLCPLVCCFLDPRLPPLPAAQTATDSRSVSVSLGGNLLCFCDGHLVLLLIQPLTLWLLTRTGLAGEYYWMSIWPHYKGVAMGNQLGEEGGELETWPLSPPFILLLTVDLETLEKRRSRVCSSWLNRVIAQGGTNQSVISNNSQPVNTKGKPPNIV